MTSEASAALMDRVGEDAARLGLLEMVEGREHRPEPVEIAGDVCGLDRSLDHRDVSLPFTRRPLEGGNVRVLVGQRDAHLDAVAGRDLRGDRESGLTRP